MTLAALKTMLEICEPYEAIGTTLATGSRLQKEAGVNGWKALEQVTGAEIRYRGEVSMLIFVKREGEPS